MTGNRRLNKHGFYLLRRAAQATLHVDPLAGVSHSLAAYAVVNQRLEERFLILKTIFWLAGEERDPDRGAEAAVPDERHGVRIRAEEAGQVRPEHQDQDVLVDHLPPGSLLPVKRDHLLKAELLRAMAKRI